MYWKTWDKHVFSGLKNAFYNINHDFDQKKKMEKININQVGTQIYLG